MDYKTMVINCIERIPDEQIDSFKKLYVIAKKEISRSRCAPAVKPKRVERDELMKEYADIIVHERFCR